MVLLTNCIRDARLARGDEGTIVVIVPAEKLIDATESQFSWTKNYDTETSAMDCVAGVTAR